jgi:multicomponent Na+:H+ antiporter subunit B
MTSIILSTATRYLLPLLLLLSVYLLVHGHNVPGGGFVGGLVASAAFALFTLAHGVRRARKTLHFSPRTLIGLGLLTVFASGCLGLFYNKPFLTGMWSSLEIPLLGKIGTPIVFDTGVYLVVIGVALTIIFSLAEE